MPALFPQAVPEIPVCRLDEAASHYVNVLGFSLDWGNEDGGIAGISQGDCRMFLTNTAFREGCRNSPPVVIWLNLNSRSEVDELFVRWRNAGATIVATPQDQPWKLREFIAADPDGNRLRVFYDFSAEERAA